VNQLLTQRSTVAAAATAFDVNGQQVDCGAALALTGQLLPVAT
jgi:hypothetical protein